MNEEALKDAYGLFVNTGYKGSIDDFSALIDTNQEALTDAHKLFVETGYNGSIEDFAGLVKKKGQTEPSTEFAQETTELVSEEPQVDGGSESVTVETPYQPKFKPEEEAGSRYKQAGEDEYLPKVIDGLAQRIADKEAQLAKLQSKVVSSASYGMPNMSRGSDGGAAFRKAEDELNALKKVYRKKKESKALIDSQYAAEQLGEGEAIEDVSNTIKAEQSLEGDLTDFLLRGVSNAAKIAFPMTSFENESTSKQRAKEALEVYVDEKLKDSSERVSASQQAFQAQATDLASQTTAALEQQAELYKSGQISYEEYTDNYANTVEAYESQKAKIESAYDTKAAFVDDYIGALENLSIINQYDDLDPIESGVKSFTNELIKTPRQIGGLLKATTPILEYLSEVPLDVYGNKLTDGVSQEQFLDLFSPVTDFLSETTNANLLRTDEDDSKANMIGEVSGQLAKIIPASIANPAAGIAVSAGMSFDEMYQTAKQGDVTEAEAVNMAAIYTPIGTLLEYAGARTAIGALDKKAVQKLAFKIIKDKGLLQMGKKQAQIELKDNLFKQLGINMTKEFFEEGTTEALQTIAQEGIKQGKNIESGREVYKYDSETFIDNIKEAFVYGGIAGAGASGVSTAIGMGGKPKQNYEVYKETITNPTIYNRLVDKISNDKEMTDGDKAIAFDTMKRDLETFQSVEGLNLSTSTQKKAVELITRKKVLEKAIEGKDKALTADIRKQIKAIDETLESFKPQIETGVENEMQEAVQEEAEKVVEEQEKETVEGETKQEPTIDTNKITEDGDTNNTPNAGVEEAQTAEQTEVDFKPESKPISQTKETEVYVMNGEKGTIRTLEDENMVVFETQDRIIDLGTKEQVSETDIAEFGIEQEAPLNIAVQPDNSVEIEGTKYVNNFSDPQAAINYDNDGNVVSVNLENESGQKRTIRGQRAQEIAYQYKLKQFEENATEQTIARLEQEVAAVEEQAKSAPVEQKKRVARPTKQKVTAPPKKPTTEKVSPKPDKKTKEVRVKPDAKKVESKPKQETAKKPEPTKTEKKQKAFDSIDSVAEALKKKFSIELPEGTQKMGISQEQLIDLAAKAAKAIAATGIEINEAIKKVVAEYKSMGLLEGIDEVGLSLSIRDEANKDVFKTTPEQSFRQLKEGETFLETEAGERITGLRNSLLPEGTEERTDGVKSRLKRTAQGVLDSGKASVESGAVRPMILVQEVLNNPRQLTVDESAALIYYKLKLLKEIDILAETINDKDTNKQDLSQAQLLLVDKMKQLEDLNSSTNISGMLNAQSLWIRGLLVNAEYNLVTQVGVMKAFTGRKTLPADMMERFKEYDRQIKEYEERMRAKESELENVKGKLTVASAPKGKTAKEKGKAVANKIRKAKFISKYKQLNKLQSSAAALPIAVWDSSVELIATTIQETGNIITAVDTAIKTLKDTDWYENLKNKSEADKILNSLYSDAGLRMPTYEDGVLTISDGFIKDVIIAGNDTIETATAKTMEILQGEGIELDERTVRDAITRYGKQSELSKDEINKKLRGLRRYGKLVSALEDVQKKKRPLRSGVKRDALTTKERELKQKINDLLKDIPLSSKELESQWKTAYDATVSRVKNRIEDVKRQIEAGKKDEKKRDTPTSPELEALRGQLKDLNKILNSIDGRETKKMSFEKKARLIENALVGLIEEYDRRIKEEDFTIPEKTKVSTPKIEKLRDILAAKKKAYKELEERKAPQIEQARKDRNRLAQIDREIQKVQKQIAGELEIEAKKTAKREKPQLVKNAEARLNALRDILKDTDRYREVATKKKLENAKKATKKSIERYEERIKNREFVLERKEQVLDKELKVLRARQRAAKEKFELEKHRWILTQRSPFQVFLDSIAEVFALPRTLMASLDLSAPLRQGLILTAANPRLAAKAFKQMFVQMANKQKYEDWLYELQETEEYQFAKSAGLYIAMPNAALLAQEEQFVSRLAERIPGHGKLVAASNRAYSTYLNVLRWGVWTEVTSRMEKNGLDQTKDKNVFKGMARFINSTTGRGQLYTDNAIGTSSSSSERTLNALFFAPRYVVSRFNLINPIYYARLPKAIRKEVLRTMLSYLATLGIIQGLGILAGGEVEDDPRSSDFGKIRFGDLRFDFMAGIQQPVRLIASIITRQKKSIVTGEIKDLNLGTFKDQTVEDEILRFIKTKFSPVAGTFFDAARAPKDTYKEVNLPFFSYEDKVLFRNMMGEDMTTAEKLLGLVSPLFISDIKEIYQEEGFGMASGAFIPALFGAGTQYFDPSKSEEESEEENSDLQLDSTEFDFDEMDLDTDVNFE